MECKKVSVLRSKWSIKDLPFENKKTAVMLIKGIAINKSSRGGMVFVTVKNPVAATAD